MSKPKREKNYDALGEARLRHARVSARKARLVCDLIRGKRVKDALDLLSVTHKPSAGPMVLEVLKSAAANAKAQHDVQPDDLVVSEVFVDGAMMLKRTRPAPMGRAVRVRKRMCHITIRLNER
jgi:large subunit ribosomal protein L22